MAKFEGQERRMPKIEACLKENNLGTLDDCRQMLLDKGIDVEAIKKGADANEAMEKAKSHYGQWDAAARYIDPRQE